MSKKDYKMEQVQVHFIFLKTKRLDHTVHDALILLERPVSELRFKDVCVIQSA